MKCWECLRDARVARSVNKTFVTPSVQLCLRVWERFSIRGRPLDTSPVVFFLLCNRSSNKGGTWLFVTLSTHKRKWEGMVMMRLAQNLAERKGDGT